MVSARRFVMVSARRFVMVLVGAFGGAWFARIVLAFVDPADAVTALLYATGALVGGVAGYVEGRGLEAWSPRRARIGVTKVGAVIALIAVLPVLLLPMPWRLFGALAIGVIALVAIPRARRHAGEAAQGPFDARHS